MHRSPNFLTHGAPLLQDGSKFKFHSVDAVLKSGSFNESSLCIGYNESYLAVLSHSDVYFAALD